MECRNHFSKHWRYESREASSRNWLQNRDIGLSLINNDGLHENESLHLLWRWTRGHKEKLLFKVLESFSTTFVPQLGFMYTKRKVEVLSGSENSSVEELEVEEKDFERIEKAFLKIYPDRKSENEEEIGPSDDHRPISHMHKNARFKVYHCRSTQVHRELNVLNYMESYNSHLWLCSTFSFGHAGRWQLASSQLFVVSNFFRNVYFKILNCSSLRKKALFYHRFIATNLKEILRTATSTENCNSSYTVLLFAFH